VKWGGEKSDGGGEKKVYPQGRKFALAAPMKTKKKASSRERIWSGGGALYGRNDAIDGRDREEKVRYRVHKKTREELCPSRFIE